MKIGDRVQLHPATDHWMRGDRFGEIISIGRGAYRTRYRVKLDKSGREVRLLAEEIVEVIEPDGL